MAEPFNIVYLPEHILIQIFSYMSYSEISESREVCQTFNRVCSRELTKAFVRVDRLHSQIQKNIKSQLPRKESERRNHALSRFVDVLSAMETRLSLLSMTYTKYIDLDLCCFIPGKVLDEMYRLLHRLQNTDTQPPRSYDLLQSLRDLSTMAMEHFEEFIVPILKTQMNDCSQSLYFSPAASSSSLPLNSSLGSGPFNSSIDMSGASMLDYTWAMPMPMVSTPWRRTPLKLDIQRVQSQMQMHSAAITTMTKEYREQKVKIGEQSRIIAEQDRKMQAQTRLLRELKGHMQAQEKNIEILTSHLAAITGKEVILPEAKPWDQTLWDPPIRAVASTSSHDNGICEEIPFTYVDVGVREGPVLSKFRHFVTEPEADEKLKETKGRALTPPKTEISTCHQQSCSICLKQKGQTDALGNFPYLEGIAFQMNEECTGFSSSCPTQRLLLQVAIKIQSIAAYHSLPLCLVEAPKEKVVDAKEPTSFILDQLTTAHQQLTKLFEEHAGCIICCETYAHFLPPASRQEPEICNSAAVANQGLINRAQELYNKLQNLSSLSHDNTGTHVAIKSEEIANVDFKGKGKGKGSLKRGRPVPKSDTDKVEPKDDGKSETTGKGRKRRRR